MLKINCSVVLFFVFCCLILAQEPQIYRQPVWSYDGGKLLLTQDDNQGVYYWDKSENNLYQIAQGRGVGYKFNWSYDNTKIAFKMLIQQDDIIVQIPVVFDTTTRIIRHLAPAGNACGVPFFSKDGKISFSVGQNVYVLDANYSLLCEVAIGNYANLCVISPDGNWVAYNNSREQICIFSTKTLKKIQLTRDNHAYFSPIWSPDSSKIMVCTVNGMIKIIDLQNKNAYMLGQGENPCWIDNTKIIYGKREIEQEKVTNCDLYRSSFDGTNIQNMTQSKENFESYVHYQNGHIAIYDENVKSIHIPESSTLDRADLANFSITSKQTLLLPTAKKIDIISQESSLMIPNQIFGEDRATTVISGVPYMHQVYDTPNWYNGHWACGGTSAMMAIAYYGILPYWDCTVSVPYSHVSHYGRYICEQYTYNGYTFSQMTTDPNGKAAYGGYGFICQNNWENTKSHMAEYFQKHGVSSSVDWSPTWDELKNKVNNNHPMVILTSLTSAGHYILGIGYYNAQHTVVVNDPYGNKNSGYMNYNGKSVSYDWPGYNNGFSNLNTVHCFIYAK